MKIIIFFAELGEAKLSKTPVRVNPLAFDVYGIYSSNTAVEFLQHLQTELLKTPKRMGCTSCKDDLIAHVLSSKSYQRTE